VLALPAEPGHLAERLFHHRRGIDEHLHLAAAGFRDQPGAQFLQPSLDHLVIVAVAGIDRDRAAVRLAEDRQRVLVRAVVHAEDDDRAHIGPERLRRAPALQRFRHPAHGAVPAVRQKRFEPRPGRDVALARRDADGIEAEPAGIGVEEGSEGGGGDHCRDIADRRAPAYAAAAGQAAVLSSPVSIPLRHLGRSSSISFSRQG
jgi:hypothetical protein